MSCVFGAFDDQTTFNLGAFNDLGDRRIEKAFALAARELTHSDLVGVFSLRLAIVAGEPDAFVAEILSFDGGRFMGCEACVVLFLEESISLNDMSEAEDFPSWRP